MLQHYVEFSKNIETEGLWGTIRNVGTEVAVLTGRSLNEVNLIKPKDAFAFRFFDRNVVECEDGEVLQGEKKNWSGLYYYGKGPFTEEELLSYDEGEKYKEGIALMRDVHGYNQLRKYSAEDDEPEKFPDFFVITEDGEVHPLYPDDAVISPHDNEA